MSISRRSFVGLGAAASAGATLWRPAAMAAPRQPIRREPGKHLRIGVVTCHPHRHHQHYFLPPLLEFQRMIERGVMPQNHDHIIEKLAVHLAGFKSHLQRGGEPVALSELDDGFTVQSDPEPLTDTARALGDVS